MSYEQLKIQIEGVSPLIMHSSQLADPQNKWVRAMKEILKKPAKKRTDEDLIELARLEFMGSLYVGESGPMIPGVNLEALVVEGAKKTRDGKTAKSGLIVENDAPLVYDGPKDADKLWDDKRFVSVASAKVPGGRVMRTRPRFNSWSLKFDALYLPGVISKNAIETWLNTSGSLCGLGDWRPRYGRFIVKSFE